SPSSPEPAASPFRIAFIARTRRHPIPHRLHRPNPLPLHSASPSSPEPAATHHYITHGSLWNPTDARDSVKTIRGLRPGEGVNKLESQSLSRLCRLPCGKALPFRSRRPFPFLRLRRRPGEGVKEKRDRVVGGPIRAQRAHRPCSSVSL